MAPTQKVYSAAEEFAMMYKCLTAEGSKKEQLVNKYFGNRDMPVTVDGKQMQMHALIRSETLDGAALLVPEIINAINEGSQPAMASLADMYYTINTTSNQVKIPRGNKNSFGSYAAIGTEGNAVAVDNNRVLYSTIDIIKPMTTVEITREMVQDAEVDIMAREMTAAGARIGNTMQSIALYELINSAAEASSETVNSAKTLKEAINVEIANVQKNGYVPDRIVLSPKAGAWLRDELSPGYYAGNDAMTLSRVPQLYGIRVEVANVAPATKSGSYSPGAGSFGGTNGIGAVVYARDKAVAVAIRDPVGTDAPFKDVYKDLTAVTATARFGAGAIHKLDTDNGDVNAAVYISY